jgi:hypothetical protein
MADQQTSSRRRVRRSLDDHRDALAVILLVAAVVACIVGLLWLTDGSIDGILSTTSGTV